MNRQKLSPRTLALVGMLSALVFALSLIELRIPLGLGDNTRIHFGNIMCLLSGVLFGPWVGGLAAGFGSMIFDLTNPLYVSEFWITFLTKFAMGFVAGALCRHLPRRLPLWPRTLASALGGSLTYIVLYVLKSIIMQTLVYGNPLAAAWGVVAAKALVSTVNGMIAVAACVLLAPPLGAALRSAGLFRQYLGGFGGKKTT